MKKNYSFLFICLLFIWLDCFSQSAVCAYKYRKRIAFDPTKVSGSSDLTDFTALISISSDADLETVANGGHVENASGFDIIFTGDDGVTKLDHQLEKYTATTGELIAWVRIPSLSTTNTTYIYVYYGNTAISANQSVNSTWSSGYKGVWHLNNNVLTDGTSNGNNGTNGGSTNLAAAKIAGGRSFAGTGSNYLQLPLSGASGGSGNGSVSFWGNLSSYTTSTYFFGETTNQTGYSNRVQLYIGDAVGNLYLGLGGTHALQTNVQLLSTNTWYHIALTWATSGSGVGTYTIFVNGIQRGSAAYSAFTAIHTFADMGNDGNASQRNEELPGSMDEVHVTNTTLSLDWVLTEYNNQNSPSTFYTVSAEPKVWLGSNNTNYNSAVNWLSNDAATSGDDVIIHNGSNQPMVQANEQVNNLFIRTGATLSLGANNLSVRSDITNCGTIAGNTGLVTLNSSTVQVQNLSGSGTFSLNNLTVDNTFSSNPYVVLNTNVSVTGALTLTSGIVQTTSTNILALGTSATSTSGSAGSFVSGPMTKAGTANFVFPVGKGTRWRRVALSNITATSTFQAEYFNTAFTSTTPVNSPLTDVSQLEYWQVDRNAGTGNANLSLYWEAANQSGINDCTDLTIARWNGSSWDERPGTTVGGSSCTGAGTGTITSGSAITAFSPFAFGSKSTVLNPLPVELVEFTGTCESGKVLLNWRTASETNSSYFMIEESTDGEIWTVIGHVKSTGSGSSGKSYFFPVEHHSNHVIIYYRLSQVDNDGKKESFKIISPTCVSSFETMTVYPNPATNVITIMTDASKDYGDVCIKVTDNLGRYCVGQMVKLKKGISLFPLSLDLSPGVYSIFIFSRQLTFPVQKLIIK